MRRTRHAALAVLATLALAACGSDGGAQAGGSPSPASSPTGTPSPRPSSTAELTIESPETGAVIEGSVVQLRVGLDGATLVPQTTTEIAPDEGHLHVLLDDTLISMTEGLEQAIPDVRPGPHRLTIEFVAADHVPFDPRVVAVTAFEVTG
jgi:hypothetical protein